MDNKIRRGTVCFLQKDNQLLLALIEYSPTDMKWTGIGGWSEVGESLEDAVVREIAEETYIEVNKNDLRKVAEIGTLETFQLNVFMAYKWSGKIKPKEPSVKELKWFPVNKLPFPQMHPGSDKWLPKVLEGKLLKSTGDQITEVEKFD
ncbi:MAG: Adenylosuccinate synthetase [Microgenomates group bacterium Gr01-1014_16]|nr:MAG: Adenylosuccinate synthetase [Microgenomates group bacterium Gr01-1014_16]